MTDKFNYWIKFVYQKVSFVLGPFSVVARLSQPQCALEQSCYSSRSSVIRVSLLLSYMSHNTYDKLLLKLFKIKSLLIHV